MYKELEAQINIIDIGYLLKLMERVKKPNVKIAEIGCYEGGTTVFLGSMARDMGGMVYAIDIWKQKRILNKFKDVMKCSGLQDFVSLLHMSSEQACHHFEDNSLDLVFIDASHTYSNVKQDLELWMPKVKPHGILCGHDCEKKYSRCSKEEQALIDENKELESTPIPFHPGVGRALYDVFNDDYEKLGDDIVCRMWAKEKPP